MPRTCTVCGHPERDAIDRLLIEGVSYRDISRQYGLSKDALARHADGHIPAHLSRAREAAQVAGADDLLGQLRDLQRRTLALLTTAERSGEIVPALQAIGQARKNLELLGKLAGQLQQEGAVNIHLSTEWRGAVVVLLAALAPFPEARAAAAAALAGVASDG